MSPCHNESRRFSQWMRFSKVALISAACLAAPSLSIADTTSAGTVNQPLCKLPDQPWQQFKRRPAWTMGFDSGKLYRAMSSNWFLSVSQHTMVIRHGCLVGQRLQMSSEWRPYEGYSVSKSIASMGLGVAVDRGELSWADPVGSLDARADIPRGGITLKHLANATAGLKRGFLEDFGYTRSFLENGWFFGNDLALINMSRPLIHEPGTYWQYSQGNIGQASAMLKKATGLGLKRYLDRHVMSKLGIPWWGWNWWRDRTDTEFGFAGASMPTPLYARLGQLVLQNGIYNGKRVLPEHYIEDIKSDQNKNPIYSRMVWNNLGLNGELVAGPFSRNPVKGRLMPGVPKDMLMFLGGSGNLVAIIPSLDMVIVHNQSLSYNNPGINTMLRLINLIVHSINDGSIDYLGPYKPLGSVIDLSPDGSVDTGGAINDALFGNGNPPPVPAPAPRPRALAILKATTTGSGLNLAIKCPSVGGTGHCKGKVSVKNQDQNYALTAGAKGSVVFSNLSVAKGDQLTITATNTTGNEILLGKAATTVNELSVRVED